MQDQAKGQEKTVEQVKKNIQALKGLPASQLNMVMDYFAASLGVRCDHCHVIDATGWYMDKDDKPTKRTARKMIQMVMDLNSKEFGGRSAVTCYTCHHGSSEPAKMITLPQPPAKGGDEEETAAALPATEQVIAMYEKALGGADAVKKITSRVSKGVEVNQDGKEAPLEIAQQGSDKYVSTATINEGMTRTEGVNGEKGWMSSPRGARPLSPDQVEEVKRDGALFPLSRIMELAKTAHVSKKETVNGVPAFELASPAGERTTERYYIDSAKGLLVRRVIVTETMVGNIPEQVDYSDYRAIDGVQVPFEVRISAVDPRDNSTRRFKTIEQNTTIDEKKFAVPEMKPRGR
jgi:hypothetical protein